MFFYIKLLHLLYIKGDLVSSKYTYNIETYKTQATAKKLAKEIKELIKNDDRFKEYIQWNF